MLKPLTRQLAIGSLVLVLLTAACAAPAQTATRSEAESPAAPAPAVAGPGVAAPAPASTELLAALQETLQGVYARVNPSVVHIRVAQQGEARFPDLPEIPGLPSQRGPQEFFQRGEGSGFVWDAEGRIVTNQHVVDGATDISVTFQDGTTVPARVIGSDPDSDLAVIQVDVPAERLVPVELADSDAVRAGQLAVAIGNPFALEGTMTVGFVSAVGRGLPVAASGQGGRYTIPDVIQTDAAINPGNSGGVLVDDAGRVIGVTSAIVSPAGTSAGIGFAIPSNIAKQVVPSLIATGTYKHPWLGISGSTLTPEVARALGLPEAQRGALVNEVIAASPAEKASLRGGDRTVTVARREMAVGGDVIVAVNGAPVRRFDDLVSYLTRSTRVGTTVTLTVLREGESVEVQVTLAERPASRG